MAASKYSAATQQVGYAEAKKKNYFYYSKIGLGFSSRRQ